MFVLRCIAVFLAFGSSAGQSTKTLPYDDSQTPPCPRSCVDRVCKNVAVTGTFYSYNVFEDCTHGCISHMWGQKGYGQCWGTGYYDTNNCPRGEKNFECQCQKIVQTDECYEKGKTVDGQWEAWSQWTKCSKVCAGGTRSRWRLCNNPPPQYGGNTCTGLAREDQDCNTASCPPCRSDVQSDCPSWIPLRTRGGEGFDVMTLTPRTKKIINVDQFGKCQQHWETNECLRVPKSVQEWRYNPSCVREISSETFHSVKELNTMQEDYVSDSWKVGLDTEIKFPGGSSFTAEGSVAGSNSKMSTWARRQAEHAQTQYQNLELNCQLYEFSLLASNLPLTPDFARSIKTLPTNLSLDSISDYEALLYDFGTHYFDKLILGGKIKSLTAIVESDLTENDMTSSDAQDCLSMEAKARLKITAVKLIDIGVGASAEYNKCARKSSSTDQYLYTSNFISKRYYEVKGGSLDTQRDLLFSPETQVNYYRWLAEIKYHPGVYRYNAQPLYRVLRKIDAEQRENLRPHEFDDLGKKAENLRKVTIKYINGKMDEIDCSILDEKPLWCKGSGATQYLSIALLLVSFFLHVFIAGENHL